MKRIFSLLFVLFFLTACNNEGAVSFYVKKRNTVVGIQAFDSFNSSLIDTLQRSIQDIYGFETEILKAVPMPQSAFINLKSPRYRADTLIRYLRRNKPDSIDFVIGLTSKDISTTKRDKDGNIKDPVYKYKDWGIFGLGFVNGPSCVVSTYRLKSDRSKFIDRFKKVCIHELGHNLGLGHCKYHERCVMKDAEETIKTIDNEDLMLCDKCKSLINI
jgi:archaemetzincin